MSSPRSRLLRRHVLERADHCPELRGRRLVGELAGGRLGDAEVDDPGHGLTVDERDEDVGRLEVAVGLPPSDGRTDRLANRHEQLQAQLGGEPALVAEAPLQGQAVDQLHDEERLTRRRDAAVEDTGDVGVVGAAQRWLYEAHQHRLAVHAGLMSLTATLPH